MKYDRFPEDFTWGTAASSYQIEGAYDEDGRGVSIWDTFCRVPGKVLQGDRGDVACDHYHRYKEDIALMKRLGVKVYRLSLAWPRIFPQGGGELNPKGIEFYNRVIDELLANGIEPCITLFHWDLPQPLEDKGGWRVRETAFHYAHYAETCFKAFADRVKLWITINEPFCIAYQGYYEGIHAPGVQGDMGTVMEVTHHVNLAHGLALKSYREGGYGGRIGTSLNLMVARPATDSAEDRLAAELYTDRFSRIFIDPLFGKGYPERLLSTLEGVNVPIAEGDMELIAGQMDFLGINYYTEEVVSRDESDERGYRNEIGPYPVTDMNWPIVPAGLYRLLNWVKDNYGDIPLYLTENGCACKDRLNDSGDRCHDPERIAYMKEHLKACLKALEEGINLKGYFLWSFIDNFEWSFGYTKRFGLIYNNFETQKRTPKDSYYYFREVIAGNELFI